MKLVVDERLTRNHAVHFSNKAATRFTRNSVATINKFLACAKRGSDCGCGHGPKSGPAKTGPAIPLATPMQYVGNVITRLSKVRNSYRLTQIL